MSVVVISLEIEMDTQAYRPTGVLWLDGSTKVLLGTLTTREVDTVVGAIDRLAPGRASAAWEAAKGLYARKADEACKSCLRVAESMRAARRDLEVPTSEPEVPDGGE